MRKFIQSVPWRDAAAVLFFLIVMPTGCALGLDLLERYPIVPKLPFAVWWIVSFTLALITCILILREEIEAWLEEKVSAFVGLRTRRRQRGVAALKEGGGAEVLLPLDKAITERVVGSVLETALNACEQRLAVVLRTLEESGTRSYQAIQGDRAAACVNLKKALVELESARARVRESGHKMPDGQEAAWRLLKKRVEDALQQFDSLGATILDGQMISPRGTPINMPRR